LIADFSAHNAGVWWSKWESNPTCFGDGQTQYPFANVTPSCLNKMIGVVMALGQKFVARVGSAIFGLG